MCSMRLVIWGMCVAGAVSCASPQAVVEPQQAATSKSAVTPKTATPEGSWVAERVAEARERLSKSEAGKLLWRSIEFHGGLARWYSNGPLYFRFTYKPLNGHPTRDTYQTVDTWSARARHRLADDTSVEFGWDGEKAWVSPAHAEPMKHPRFWSLTPYYFVAMPFVLADPGVHLKKLGSAQLHGRPHDVLKATFGADVGDSPGDYYIIYLDAQTGRFAGLRYVVSYPGFFPNGGHSPEHLMVYRGEQTTDGITFAKGMSTYTFDAAANKRGEHITEVSVTDIGFRPDTPDAYFDVPENARVIEGY